MPKNWEKMNKNISYYKDDKGYAFSGAEGTRKSHWNSIISVCLTP